MENNETFLTLYKDLEQILKRNIGDDYIENAIYLLEKSSSPPRNNQIKVIRDTRNLMQHNSTKIDGKDVFLVSDTTLELLKRLIHEQENPKKAFDVCTKIQKLVIANLQTPLQSVINVMTEKNYSHIPILDNNGYLLGVFSENTLFSKIVKDKIVLIEDSNLISDFLDVLPIDKHGSEAFDYVPRTMKVEEIKTLFNNDYPNQKRLALLFMTEHGDASEKILGMITPWDVIPY